MEYIEPGGASYVPMGSGTPSRKTPPQHTWFAFVFLAHDVDFWGCPLTDLVAVPHISYNIPFDTTQAATTFQRHLAKEFMDNDLLFSTIQNIREIENGNIL